MPTRKLIPKPYEEQSLTLCRSDIYGFSAGPPGEPQNTPAKLSRTREQLPWPVLHAQLILKMTLERRLVNQPLIDRKKESFLSIDLERQINKLQTHPLEDHRSAVLGNEIE
ncbi:hypothetical protein SCP_0601900 [Sparassis crispa]|uniref:Uncharacterized protein n=1 Tax=Sparassis crispa TaxID=139825 RepID=A0A401GPT4_9APHY|nr:hypothetical protein SCP_0601900 [Sparassis crispa]GBE84212.1 hypothetical protein SCP_0601900 [Sparassis crispa]